MGQRVDHKLCRNQRTMVDNKQAYCKRAKWKKLSMMTDLNTSYSFSNIAAGLRSLRRLHMCLLCVYYVVYGPWLTHSIYACVVYLRAETYISICICGSGGYACAFCNHVYSILASALIYANMYMTKMYVSLKPALKSMQLKHTWG